MIFGRVVIYGGEYGGNYGSALWVKAGGEVGAHGGDGVDQQNLIASRSAMWYRDNWAQGVPTIRRCQMNVPIKDFYQEVTGGTRTNGAMLNDLKAWGIPTVVRGEGNGIRKHFGVDIQHLGEAKAKWELEKATKPERSAPRPSTDKVLEELAAIENRLTNRIRGIETALNALMKLAKS